MEQKVRFTFKCRGKQKGAEAPRWIGPLLSVHANSTLSEEL